MESEGNASIIRREEFVPLSAATAVALAGLPTEVLSVSRNGVEQQNSGGHYAHAGNVITFTDPFVAGERVGVVYEIGTAVAPPGSSYTKEESDERFVNVDGDRMTGDLVVQYAPGEISTTYDDYGLTIRGADGTTRFRLSGSNGGELIFADGGIYVGAVDEGDPTRGLYIDRGLRVQGDLTIRKTAGSGDPLRIDYGTDPFPRFAVDQFGALRLGSGGSAGVSLQSNLGGSVLTVGGALNPTPTLARDLGASNARWRKLWAQEADFATPPTIGGVGLDDRYVNTAGDTVTGALYVGAGDLWSYSDSGNARLVVQSAANHQASVQLNKAGVPRWQVRASGAVEAGSNAGTAFEIERYADDGTPLGTALTLSRATGDAVFGADVRVPGAYRGTPGGHLTLAADLSIQIFTGPSGYVFPVPSGNTILGHPDYRWQRVYSDGVTAQGDIRTEGAAAGVFIGDRGGLGTWIEYANGDALRWWNSVDKMVLTNAGVLSVLGKPVLPSPDAGNALVWNANGFYVAPGGEPGGGGISQADADLRYVNVVGADTAEGPLTISGGSLKLGSGQPGTITSDGNLNLTPGGNVYLLPAGGGPGYVLGGWAADGASPTYLGHPSYRWARIYTGPVDLSHPVDPSMSISGPAGTARAVNFKTDGVARWGIYAYYSTETGSNVGSDLAIARMNDAGTYLGNALTIERATGTATFERDVTVNGVAAATGILTIHGARGIIHLNNTGESIINSPRPRRSRSGRVPTCTSTLRPPTSTPRATSPTPSAHRRCAGTWSTPGAPSSQRPPPSVPSRWTPATSTPRATG